MMVDNGELERGIAIRLGALEQIFDVDVSVWKRVAAENDVLYFTQGNVGVIPD